MIHTDPNGSASPLEISLKPGQAVQGRVVDEAGKPLEGVVIDAGNWLGYRARLNLTTKTGADGKFRSTDAPPSVIPISEDTDEVEPAANVVAEKRFGSL